MESYNETSNQLDSIKNRIQIKEFKHNQNESSQFIYVPNYLDSKQLETVSKYLDDITDFRCNMNYKNNGPNRLQKWYQQENKYFCPLWKERFDWWEACPYDDFLQTFQDQLQSDISNVSRKSSKDSYYYRDPLSISELLRQHDIKIPEINSCLINKYRDGSDFIAAHSDSYHSFGKYPTIIGISIGDERVLKFKTVADNHQKICGLSKNNKVNKDDEFQFNLESGSLFIMAGCSQKYFSHEICKSDSMCSRYSLTFRNFIL